MRDERYAARRRLAAAHRLEQSIRHASGKRARGFRLEHRADRKINPELRAETPAGLFEARDATACIETHQPRADIDRREVDHLAVGADRDLRRAAADVDIHHARLVADRTRHRARAVGRHHRLETVAGADRDELAGLPREQLADRARIAPLHGDAGQDQRAGVDLVRIDLARPYIAAR